MRTRISLAAALLSSFGVVHPAIADVCKPDLAASIDLTITPRVISALVPVSLNGQPTYLAVDTGGVVSSLRYDVAEQLSLPMEDAPFAMVNVSGQRLDRQATVRRFDLGQLSYANTKFILEPEYDLASGLHGPISGTLSPDILRNFDVEFDMAAGKLNLFTPATCSNPAYWAPDTASAVKVEVEENGHVILPVSLDGKRVEAVIDTGMSITALDLATARDKFGVDLKSSDLERFDRLNETEEGVLYRYQFKSLAIENTPIRMDAPRIQLMPDLAQSSGERVLDRPKLVLGLSSLQHMHVYIAYKQQMLYVTPASGPPAAFRGPDELNREPNSLRNHP